MAIQASGLSPAEAMDAGAGIQHRAEQYKKAGMTGGMDRLRAKAFAGRLAGRNPLGPDTPAGHQAAPRQVHLTAPEWILPLLTVLGLADTPGEAAGLGAIDPALVRQLAQTTAEAGDRSEWHLSLVNDRGWVACHGCPPADPRSNQAKAHGHDDPVTLAVREVHAAACLAAARGGGHHCLSAGACLVGGPARC